MSQTVYLNRHLPDNAELTQGLVAFKIPVLVEPLITIDYVSFEPPRVDKNTVILVTSRYGLFGLLKKCPNINRKTLIACVGKATTEAAKSLGFKNIMTGPGTAAELSTLMKTFDLDKSRLIYSRGADISFPLEENLSDLPQTFESIITYEAKATPSFSHRLVDKLQSHEIKASVFYSARTAQIFQNLIRHHALLHAAEGMTVVCMSHTVAEVLNAANYTKIIPPDFSSQALVQVINNFFSGDSS
jgi:uroporphyrinogen-III synthase